MSLSFSMDAFPLLYSGIAVFMWLMCALFCPQYLKGHKTKARFLFFFVITLFFVIGVFLAGDLFTLFLFFEGMSFSSFTWVAEEETPDAIKASKTYLTVAVVGGLVMLMGIFMLYHALSTLEISALPEAVARFLSEDNQTGNFGNRQSYLFLTGCLLLFGFAAKAGVFPLHIWLPMAHPAAPAPASAILSGMLTKCGVFGMLLVAAKIMASNLMFGEILLILGIITMLLGAVLGVLSIDIKRLLACSSVSQIGFITIGIAIVTISGGSNTDALYGSLFHCINHSVLKLILFLFSGVAVMNYHSRDLNDLMGFGRKHPFLMIAVALSGLSLAGFPGTNGYISKTLLHEGIVTCKEEMELLGNGSLVSLLSVSEVLFLIAGGLTLAYMLKLFIALFIEKGTLPEKKKLMTVSSGIAVLFPVILIPVLGLTPNTLFLSLGRMGEEYFFTANPDRTYLLNFLSMESLSGELISLLIGVVVYLLFVRPLLREKKNRVMVYVDRLPRFANLTEAVYRPFFTFLTFLLAFLSRICDTLIDGIATLLKSTVLAPKKRRMSIWVGTKLTHLFGTMLDSIVSVLNKTLFHNHPIKKSFVSVLAVSEMEAKQTLSLITGSVSFGLLLAATGLVLTLLYLLF